MPPAPRDDTAAASAPGAAPADPVGGDAVEALRAELAQLRRRVGELEGRRAPAAGGGRRGLLAGLAFPGEAVVFPARDQTEDEGGEWQELAAVGGALVDFVGGRVEDDAAPIDLDPDTEYVLVAHRDGGGAQPLRYVRLRPTPSDAVHVVALAQTGGATGTKTTAASWVYTVTRLTTPTEEIMTTATPLIGRPNGTRAAATHGLAYREAGGTWHLLYAFEQYGTGGCA